MRKIFYFLFKHTFAVYLKTIEQKIDLVWAMITS